MATFNTKFNLGDTLYIVNTEDLSIDSIGVREIFVKQSLSDSIIYIIYKGSIHGRIVEVKETEAYLLSEAQTIITTLINQRLSDINGIGG